MDFFQHQVQAKKRTTRLVFLYILGVAGLTGIPVILMTIGYFSAENSGQPIDPASFALAVSGVAGLMLFIILGGSLFKSAQLSAGGGKSVAESLGGRQISPSTRDLAERRLYNVVEEMALASGVPVPAIYIMDNEHSINAFAAGFSPNEAVIGCNRGTVELLTRDELQGVIAHEFSHILNGDMRMNLRLIGILFGLQILALIGYYVMRIGMYMPNRSRNSKDGSGGIGLAMLLGGLLVMIAGYIGVFFSAMIQAAISRQREFLADASAVQFTRNPSGIAGALKKIGCPNIGSAMQSPAAAEASHLFFGNACGLFSFGELLATHPPLSVRIKQIDPSFDGKFPQRIEPVNFYEEENRHKREIPIPQNGQKTASSLFAVPFSLNSASELMGRIPQSAAESASSPLTAKATFYAVLFDRNESVRQKQSAAVASMESDYLAKITQQIYAGIQNAEDAVKIPLAQRITSALRFLTVPQYQQFIKVVDTLIAADSKMDLLEYTLKALLLRDLDIYFGLAKPLTVRYKTLPSVQHPVAAVLSHLAYSGHSALQDAQRAFRAAVQTLNFSPPMLSAAECTVQVFDHSLRILAETEPLLKKRIFESLLTCVQFDGKIMPKEAELLRATAAMLAMPMPMF